MKILHKLPAGSFFELNEGHALFTEEVEPSVLEIGERLPLSCMFEIDEILRGGIRIGYLFNTQFYVKNEGGYVVAYMRNGAGRAETAEIMLKTEDLVIYHYPNRGTLAISPKVNPAIEVVFEEQ